VSIAESREHRSLLSASVCAEDDDSRNWTRERSAKPARRDSILKRAIPRLAPLASSSAIPDARYFEIGADSTFALAACAASAPPSSLPCNVRPECYSSHESAIRVLFSASACFVSSLIRAIVQRDAIGDRRFHRLAFSSTGSRLMP
jgi:hypothetical protein